LRSPGRNKADPIFKFDIVVTGSGGELISTNSVS
jgi:hypothetical protein